MADYHVLTGRSDGNAYTVVHHLPIPNVTNRAGVSVRTALANSGLGGKTSLPDGDGSAGSISAAEKASILAGELWEYSEQVDTHPGETAAKLRDRIDARHTALASSLVTLLGNELAYFGFTRDVP